MMIGRRGGSSKLFLTCRPEQTKGLGRAKNSFGTQGDGLRHNISHITTAAAALTTVVKTKDQTTISDFNFVCVCHQSSTTLVIPRSIQTRERHFVFVLYQARKTTYQNVAPASIFFSSTCPSLVTLSFSCIIKSGRYLATATCKA